MFASSTCVTQVLVAFLYAFVRHWGQVRKCDSCMPYIFHPILTAWIVWKYAGLVGGGRVTGVVVALLHDVLEDTNATYRSLFRWFGAEIADGVAAMSHSTDLKKCGVSKQDVLEEKGRRLVQQPIYIRVVEPAGRLANIFEPGDWTVPKLYEYTSHSVHMCTLLELPESKLTLRLGAELDLVYVGWLFWKAKQT